MRQGEIIEIVRANLRAFVSGKRVDALAETTPLITGGVLDSITLVELAAVLEDHFRIRFESYELGVDYFDTLADIARIILIKLPGSS